MVKEITVEELKERLVSGKEVILVDCREKDENAFCKIAGSICIPLSEFAERASQELSSDQEIYIHCHHGGRSKRACEFLQEQLGYKNVVNVAGGIEAWSLNIDPKVPRY